MEKHETRFYKCHICGNIVGMIEDAGQPLYCCKEEMQPLSAKSSRDCGDDKNLPLVKASNRSVSIFVGPSKHEMKDTNHVGWVYLETNQGGHRKNLSHENRPKLSFELAEQETPRAVYAYCNKHGLWKQELSSDDQSHSGCCC